MSCKSYPTQLTLLFTVVLVALVAGVAIVRATAAPQDGAAAPNAGAAQKQEEKDKESAKRKLSEGVAMVDECFATSLVCAYCHSNTAQSNAMRDAEHSPVAPFNLWDSTMMAHAARDPLWRAAVSVEVAANPTRRAAIEAKCLRCHSPMAAAERQHSLSSISMDVLYNKDAPNHQLALDGVSCTACHQIDPKNLGTPESFSGGFDIFPGKRIYGPHAQPRGGPMVNFSGGFTPEQGAHISKSSLCATCHTLFTKPLDKDGNEHDIEFPEQTPYLEWRNSIYNDEVASPSPEARTCQQCHMPQKGADGVKIRTRIARNPAGRDFGGLAPRDSFSRHVFVGGNTLIPAILRDNAKALGVGTPAYAFNATIEAAKEQLRERSARVSVVDVSRAAGKLRFGVKVENLAGHKLPSAHPTRRTWLRVVIKDRDETVLFRSGGHDGNGALVDRSGKLLATERRGAGYQPHYDVVRSDEQVQIFEAILGDLDGKVTYSLMQAASYLKDNRLLPRGWRPDHPDAKATAPAGLGGDTDFVGGQDTTRYEVAVPDGQRLAIEVTLLHQVLGSRFAAELLAWDTPEVREFAGYYEKADRTPDLMGEVNVAVPAKP
ncbi:MAG: hypothetical protein AAF581_02690 [Planctomycetota bacterium]